MHLIVPTINKIYRLVESIRVSDISSDFLWQSISWIVYGFFLVSDLSLISDLSKKFKHHLLRVKSELKLSGKQHPTPDVLAADGTWPSEPSHYLNQRWVIVK